MNYLKPKLRDALASSYVLGTLQGPARKRYEKLMMRYESLSQATWYWEQKLNPWSDALPAVPPPPVVWTRIHAQINASAVSPASVPSSATGWKWLSGFAIAAVLVLAVLLIQPSSPPTPVPAYLAVMTASDDKPLWLIEAKGQQLLVKPTVQLPSLPDNDYELWIVPANGGSPISLGVLAQDSVMSVALDAGITLTEIKALAVSKEAKGGSVSGAPAEVLYLSGLIAVAS